MMTLTIELEPEVERRLARAANVRGMHATDLARHLIEENLPEGEAAPRQELLVADLGWSRADARDTYLRLRAFEEDWEAPGMEAYDDL